MLAAGTPFRVPAPQSWRLALLQMGSLQDLVRGHGAGGRLHSEHVAALAGADATIRAQITGVSRLSAAGRPVPAAAAT